MKTGKTGPNFCNLIKNSQEKCFIDLYYFTGVRPASTRKHIVSRLSCVEGRDQSIDALWDDVLCCYLEAYLCRLLWGREEEWRGEINDRNKQTKSSEKQTKNPKTSDQKNILIQTIFLSKGKDGGTNSTLCILNLFYSVLKESCEVKLWLLFFPITTHLEEINIS